MLTQLGSDIPSKVPVLIAGWPGMGQVGVGAADYLRRKLGARLIARIDVADAAPHEGIVVREGLGAFPEPPVQLVYLVEEPAAFLFQAEAQVGGEAGSKVAGALLDFATMHGAAHVYTGAAYALPVSFRHPTQVFGVATDDQTRAQFSSLGVEPLNEGRITGLNGVLLGLARQRGLSAACFLATMPQYAIESPNPRASKAVVHVFERILNTTVDMAELDGAIRESEKMLGEFEDRVSEAVRSLRSSVEHDEPDEESEPDEQEPERGPEREERPEPHVLMERIERLFEAAQSDRSQAMRLKRELDRWGLFGLYEDRFLDLFERRK
jgi:predicted ATP-grasp superfamily ATP-dependent carboligase